MLNIKDVQPGTRIKVVGSIHFVGVVTKLYNNPNPDIGKMLVIKFDNHNTEIHLNFNNWSKDLEALDEHSTKETEETHAKA